LYLDPEAVKSMIEKFEKDTKAIKEELFKMCWYLRGGLSYTEALNLSFEERQIIGKIIENNLEITKETGQPFF